MEETIEQAVQREINEWLHEGRGENADKTCVVLFTKRDTLDKRQLKDYVLDVISRTRKEATEEAWREAGKEQIICAAIRAKNGKLYPCAYHGQGMEQRGYQQKYYGDDSYAEDAQGFITSRNRFVDRVEGLAIALAAGQVEEDRHGKDKLMSEDLPYNRFEHLIQAAKERGVNIEV